MKEFQICIQLPKNLEKKYIDNLIVSIVRCGYDVYLGYEEDTVCFKASDEEVRETK